MKKFFTLIFIILFFPSIAFAGITTMYKRGEGSLKLTEDMANILEYYFSGGTQGVFSEKQNEKWKPGLIAVSEDGSNFSYFRHPMHVTEVDGKQYAGAAIKDCQKRSGGKKCYLFATGYKIVWDNGSDKKRRRLKRKEVMSGKTIEILIELGFYDGAKNSSAKTENKQKKKETKSENNDSENNDIVKKLKDLKDLYDSGAITKEEFDIAKKKILN